MVHISYTIAASLAQSEHWPLTASTFNGCIGISSHSITLAQGSGVGSAGCDSEDEARLVGGDGYALF